MIKNRVILNREEHKLLLRLKGNLWLVIQAGRFPFGVFMTEDYLNFSVGFGRLVLDFNDVGC